MALGRERRVLGERGAAQDRVRGAGDLGARHRHRADALLDRGPHDLEHRVVDRRKLGAAEPDMHAQSGDLGVDVLPGAGVGVHRELAVGLERAQHVHPGRDPAVRELHAAGDVGVGDHQAQLEAGPLVAGGHDAPLVLRALHALPLHLVVVVGRDRARVERQRDPPVLDVLLAVRAELLEHLALLRGDPVAAAAAVQVGLQAAAADADELQPGGAGRRPRGVVVGLGRVARDDDAALLAGAAQSPDAAPQVSATPTGIRRAGLGERHARREQRANVDGRRFAPVVQPERVGLLNGCRTMHVYLFGHQIPVRYPNVG